VPSARSDMREAIDVGNAMVGSGGRPSAGTAPSPAPVRLVLDRPLRRLWQGDVRAGLAGLETGSVQAIMCSPPFYGLRAYGTEPQVWGGDAECEHEWGEYSEGWNNRHAVAQLRGLEGGDGVGGSANHRDYRKVAAFCRRCQAWRGELGAESNPDAFVAHLVEVFRLARRVLRDDGLLFVNLADSRASSGPMGTHGGHGPGSGVYRAKRNGKDNQHRVGGVAGIPAKSLMCIPARFQLAMLADGWIVRDFIAWAKIVCMPESVRDRFTSAWEPVFMFSKRGSYFFDAEAVRETNTEGSLARHGGGPEKPNRNRTQIHARAVPPGSSLHRGHLNVNGLYTNGRNRRNVLTLGPPRLRLRSDLTDEQKAYVFECLAAHMRRGLA
jgi:hypothetical protein